MKHTILRDKSLASRIILTTVALSILALALFPRPLWAEGTASYSYRQENVDSTGQPVTHQDSVGPVPVPLMATELTPNSSLVFDVSGLQTGPTSLAARAMLSTDVAHLGKPESWSSTKASARAEASLVDFATVQGPIDATSGTVVFNWVVSGVATLSLDTTDFNIIEVGDLSTTAVLESTIPNTMGPLLDVTFEFPNMSSAGSLWQETHGIDSGALTFDVPWQSGSEMPIFFDLTATANLDTSNIDASGFKAGLDIDLANTAVLTGVAILDENGAVLPAARLVSRDGFEYPSAPEPNALALLTIGLLVVTFGSRRR